MNKTKVLLGSDPTFALRKVDYRTIQDRYARGEYKSKEIPPSRIKGSSVNVLIAPEYSNSILEPIYSFKDKNRNVIFASVNSSSFDIFTKTGGSHKVGGRCEYCRQDFTHIGVGIPIAHSIEVFVKVDGTKFPVHVFWTDFELCDYECALALVRRLNNSNGKSTLYLCSESTLQLMFGLTHPNAGDLKPADDYRLILEHNGGSVPYVEWKSRTHKYHETTNVLKIPAKISYIRS
jgi:hypothetical protein